MAKERLFRFKQFDVSHSSAAMKVGTDGVLLGAWASIADGCRTIWDVGGGSGLIALMLAQRTVDSHVYSVEIDSEACREMSANFDGSPWSGRLTAVCGDIFRVADSLPAPDLIVSNPPFFANSPAAPDRMRSMARHEAALSFESLIRLAAARLSSTGELAMIAPADRSQEIRWFAALNRLNVARCQNVITAPGREPSRTLWLLCRNDVAEEHGRVSLRDANGQFSEWYSQLTRDFYLAL